MQPAVDASNQNREMGKMFEFDALRFGVLIRDFVKPVLEFFTLDGVAPLLAFGTQAGAAIGEGGADIQAPIKKLLAVAAFKFWTSVSGLGSSILLRVFYEWQHTRIKNLLNRINAGLERGLQFVTPEYLANEHLHEAREQTAAIR